MNPLFTTTILFLVVLIAIILVLATGQTTIELSKETARMHESEDAMRILNNYIRDVAAEDDGAKRILRFNSPELEINPEEDSVQYKTMSGVELFEYLSRRITGDLIYISGNDVNCDDSTNLTMENSFLRVELQKITEASPLTAIDTKNNILSITEKTYSRTINPANSSIIINGNVSSGFGYSGILKKGKNLPLCIAHFYINSSVSYDIYYTLYSGSDFLVIDVRNIK